MFTVSTAEECVVCGRALCRKAECRWERDKQATKIYPALLVHSWTEEGFGYRQEWYETSQQQKGRSCTNSAAVNPDDRGPLMEYDDRVDTGRLRNDEHQRG